MTAAIRDKRMTGCRMATGKRRLKRELQERFAEAGLETIEIAESSRLFSASDLVDESFSLIVLTRNHSAKESPTGESPHPYRCDEFIVHSRPRELARPLPAWRFVD